MADRLRFELTPRLAGSSLLILLCCVSACGSPPHVSVALQTGDIIFHTSKSAQSRAIQLATKSPYSHLGLVEVASNGVFVIEAIQPVSRTPLAEWIARGEGEHYVVKRVRDASTVITPEAANRLVKTALEFRGRNYDAYFGWSDDAIYCSELVWKAYDRALHIHLAELRRMRDFDLANPLVAAKLKERYGNRLPLDEAVIAPSDLYASEKLVTIAEE